MYSIGKVLKLMSLLLVGEVRSWWAIGASHRQVDDTRTGPTGSKSVFRFRTMLFSRTSLSTVMFQVLAWVVSIMAVILSLASHSTVGGRGGR